MNVLPPSLVLAALLVTSTPVAAHGSAPGVPPVSSAPYPGTITLAVDATDVERRIQRAIETFPVKPGPLTLLYPQWLPGTHSPAGRLDQFSGVECSGGDARIPWTRDPVDVWAFHFDIPKGVSTLTCRFEFLSPLDKEQGREVMTPNIVGVQWNQILLYPAGHDASRIRFQATLKLPEGFRYATALETERPAAGDAPAVFRTTSLETLVDSPLFSGRHSRTFDLDPGAAAAGRPPVRLDVFAEREASLDATPEQIDAHRRLVEQADRLFASRHYAHYDFLLSLSSQFSGIGLEHHQSSENGVRDNYFTDWKTTAAVRSLLPHEYAHSWNGKFRRPADLATPNYNVPMQDSLLWVYEGQTQYWGNVLAARSGLQDVAFAREVQAATAAIYAQRAGRDWRNLQDTTNQPIVGGRVPTEWSDWYRGADYYDEMNLVWLDVDTRIRELSGEKKSLDDFARASFGVDDGRVRVLTYTFDDVVAALNRVQPYDWRGMLRARLDAHGPDAPLDGIRRSGWELVFDDQENAYTKSVETTRRVAGFRYSLGFDVASDGNRITNVRWNGPAFTAGIVARNVLVAVNGRTYSPEILREAILGNRDGKRPIELLVKSGEYYRTETIDYRDGLRYPHLKRVEGTPDRLTQIFAAKP